jgi:AcrR family transcriptional regulator
MTQQVRRAARTDGEATRSRLLEAAGELFAASGFAETTSKAIAAQAGTDLASINYHFASRNGLYQAVLVEAHRRLIDVADLQRLATGDLAPEDKLKALMQLLVRKTSAAGGGWHLTVLAAEVLAPSSHMQVLFQSEVPAKASFVLRILSDISGIPVGDPALLRCLLSVAAPGLLMLITRRGIPGPLQAIRHMPGEVLVEHLHRFAIAGLKAVGEDFRASGKIA